ncbi:Uncharacterised protein [Mycobacterium tuberculosis]|nr:Uncharacterised protein [Mycobacterium tuberculosis]
MSQPLPGTLLQLEESLDRESPVACAGQRQDHVSHPLSRGDRRTTHRHTGIHHPEVGCQLADLPEGMDGISLGGHPELVDERSQGQPLVVDRGVVPLHHSELAHRPAWHRDFSGRQPITFGAIGICHLIRGVVLQRGQHHIGASAQMTFRQRTESTRDGGECVKVRTGFPRRIDRRTERVHVRVHIGTGQVGFLVPGRGGQHDIRHQRRRRHPEVDRHYQVELALWNVAVPHHIPGMHTVGGRVGLYVGVGAQQMPQEILAALARRADQVRPPDGEHPRPVDRVIRIGNRELQLVLGKLFGDVITHVAARGAGLVGDIETGPIELWIERAPAHRRGRGQQVHGVLAGEPAATHRAGKLVRAVAVVAPLVGVRIPVRRAGHLTRRPRPVGGHRHRLPPGQRTHLLLADVVRPPAAVASHRSGQHEQRQHRAVHDIAVEPVTDSAAHDDHRPSSGFGRVAGEFLGKPDCLRGRHTGDRLLPGRGVLLGSVVVAGRPFAGQPRTRHPVVGQHQIEHRAHQMLARPAHRHPTRHRLTVPVDGVKAGQRNQFSTAIAVDSLVHLHT